MIEVVDADAHVEGEGEGFGEGAHVREGRSSGRKRWVRMVCQDGGVEVVVEGDMRMQTDTVRDWGEPLVHPWRRRWLNGIVAMNVWLVWRS